jgi:hypothetical protein
MESIMELTQVYLKSVLHYCPETGVFTHIPRQREAFETDRAFNSWITKYANTVAGTVGYKGYRVIMVNKKIYRAHRLVFMYTNGEFPTQEVDHINGRRDDNRWANLREVSGADNSRNRRISKNNKSGANGVYYYPRHNRRKHWRAEIRHNTKCIIIGYFHSFEEAVSARKAADVKYGFHANHGGH